jgi:hypothetical protein
MPTPAKKTTPRKRTPAKAVPAKRTSPAPAMAVPAITEFPTPRITARRKVVLDLDALTKKQAFPDLDVPDEPFTFLHAGVEYELRDPRDNDWKRALELAANPFLLMRTCLVDADTPIADPTELELRFCRERLGLPGDTPGPGSDEAEREAEDWPDGFIACLVDRFTASDLPGWKLNALYANWHQHYNIDLAQGQGILSALLGKVD